MDSSSEAPRFDAPDVRALVADIEREARARRRSGVVDPHLDEELDALFDSVAPAGATRGSLDAILNSVERVANFDLHAPTASNFRGGEAVKRALQRATYWQFEHTRGQLQAFAFSITRAVRTLGERLNALERRLPGADPRLRAATPLAHDLDVTPWIPLVVESCASSPGRVLHAECGSGALVVALYEAGIDAFGVDPRPDAAEAADDAGVEARTIETLDFLDRLPAGSLGAVVLSGCVDRFLLGDQLELSRLTARAVASGGRIVVLSAEPDAPGRTRDPIQADLTFGRPLHAQTWMHLLAQQGVTAIERHDGPASGALEAGPDAPEGVAHALARVEELLFPPASYAVVGVRP